MRGEAIDLGDAVLRRAALGEREHGGGQALAVDEADELGPEAVLAVCLSGRGDKDMDTAARYFDLYDAGVGAVLEAPEDEVAADEASKGEGTKL